MTRDELIKTAIKTVIQYAEEQGVKLRRIDFKESKWIFVPDGAIKDILEYIKKFDEKYKCHFRPTGVGRLLGEENLFDIKRK